MKILIIARNGDDKIGISPSENIIGHYVLENDCGEGVEVSPEKLIECLENFIQKEI